MSEEEAIDDKTVATVLTRVVWIVNPVLDVLSETDVFDLKERTKHADDANKSLLNRGLGAVAWALNTADLPGTKSWESMSLDARSKWWVRRVGAVNTLIVAYPGVLGAIANRLPLQDALGFGNQAILLCAVAREHGLDEYQQVRLLASVLCDRTIPEQAPAGVAEAAAKEGAEDEPIKKEGKSRTPFALAKTLWRIGQMVRGITGELRKRPRPGKFFHYLGMIPVVGAVGDYFGEYSALGRAAKEAQDWIATSSTSAVG